MTFFSNSYRGYIYANLFLAQLIQYSCSFSLVRDTRIENPLSLLNKKASVASFSYLKSSNSPVEEEPKETIKEKLLDERRKATIILEEITKLEAELKTQDITSKKKNEIIEDILKLCSDVGVIAANKSESFTKSESVLLIDEALNEAELQKASDYFIKKIPFPMQMALSKFVKYSSSSSASANSFTSKDAKEIITRLYANRKNNVELKKLRDLVLVEIAFPSTQTNVVKVKSSTTAATAPTSIEELFNNDEQSQINRFVSSAFPKVTRKENTVKPTLQDVKDFVFEIESKCKKVFVPNALTPQEVPGGYIIRGTIINPEETSGNDLIDEFKKNINPHPNFCYFLVRDPTPTALEDPTSPFGDAVIFYSSNDLAPTTSRFLLSFVSALSIFLILLYSLETCSNNPMILQRIENANAIGNYGELDWINNSLLIPLVSGILGTQLCHELGHYFISRKNEFKMITPTVLPAFYLPFLGCSTSLQTSPKDLKTLFDFAITGPLLGIASSLTLFYAGLQLTNSADTATFNYFPMLSLDFVKSSNLGYQFMEFMLGSGQAGSLELLANANGFLLLHPFVIAGFAGLFVNCLNLLPLGNTDGGRMSQALFGRNGHTVIQGLFYLVLLSAALFDNSNPNANLYIGYGLFCLFGQGEFEIPCQNEIDAVFSNSFGRVVLAISTWVFMGLVISPFLP